MISKPTLKYLLHYPLEVQVKVHELIGRGGLGAWLRERYPLPPEVSNDRALYQYVMDLKSRHLKTAPPLSKICFDDKIAVLRHSLGQHAYVTRVQGKKLKAKNEIRIASLFKVTPPEFLRMVVVHELAHLRERQHGPAFYQLCCHMEPSYHDYEFGLRLYLTQRDLEGHAAPTEES